MAINLSNVNISLRQFQDVASGKYNAGEVRLTSDHSLGKINHHVSLTGSNKVSLPHAEVLAIKDAFVRSLSQNGVAADEINRIRRELGLAPDGATDVHLAERSIRPLTRQQIRTILDRNSNVINAHAGADTIRSHAELFARFTPEQRVGFAQTRNETNIAMMFQRRTLPDRGISDAQAILSGDVRFTTPAERQRLISAAELQKATILNGSHGNPSDAPGATLKFTRAADGLSVTFALGMSEKEYVRKLDDLLLYLHTHTQPHAPNAPIPEITAADANGNVLAVLTGQTTGRPTHETDTIKAEVRRKLEARYGTNVFKASTKFSTFARSDMVSAALQSIGDMADMRFTTRQIVDAIVEQAAPGVAKLYLTKALVPMIQKAGGLPGMAVGVATSMFVRHPNIKTRLLAARSPDDARAVVNAHGPEIESGVRRQITCERFREQAKTWYRERIANAMGVPVSALEARGTLNIKRMGGRGESLMLDIGAGRNAANTDEQIEQAYRDLANAAADERIDLLRQADALDVSPEARDILKHQILTLEKVAGFNLAEFKAKADAIKVGGLVGALSADAPANEVFAKMGEVGQKVETEAIAMFEGQNAGGDEIGAAANILVTLALAKQPESFDLMHAFFARPDVAETSLVNLQGPASRAVAFQLFKPEVPASESNAELADAIGKPGLASLHAQALRLAFDDLGLGNLSDAEKAKLIDGAPGRALARQVRALTKPVTPSLLRALARMALTDEAVSRAANRYVADVARRNQIASDGVAGFVSDIVFRRNGGLRAKLDAAVAKAVTAGESVDAAVTRVLEAHEATVVVALRSLDALREADATARDKAVREIARRANLDEAFVREKLDIASLRLEGGSLSFLRVTVCDELAMPETDIAVFDVAEVAHRAAARVESFIKRKVDFIAAVDHMPLSEAARGELVVETLSYPPYKDAELASAVVRILNREEITNALKYAKNILTKDKVSQIEDEDVFLVFETVAARLSAAIEAEIPEHKRAQMDNDDHAVVRSLIGAAFVDICGKELMDAAAELASGNRLNAVEEVGNKVRKSYDSDYITYSSGINAKGQQVPVDAAKATAANKSAANISFALRILGDVSAALYNEWLPADLAEAIRKTKATAEQKAFAAAIVRRVPKALERASASAALAPDAATRLRAFAITLDWRDNALAATEAIFDEGLQIIRTETDEARREERLAALANGLFNAADAGVFVASAAQTQGVQLDAAQTAKATALLAEFGAGMPAKNARILARFIASLELTDESAEIDRQRLALIGAEIAKWRDFGFADPGREAVANFFKGECNAIIREFEQADRRVNEFVNDVSRTMSVDVPRGVYTVGGKRFFKGDAADVVAELDKMDLSPAAKRALTVLMSQTSAVHVMALQIHNPLPPHDQRPRALDPSTLPGAGTFVSRGFAPQLFMSPQIVGDSLSIFDLSVSEDGRTATLKIVKSEKMNVGTTGETMNTAFGSLVVEEELTIDIASEKPSVTNVRVAQAISDDDGLEARYLSEAAPIPGSPAPAPGIPGQGLAAQ